MLWLLILLLGLASVFVGVVVFYGWLIPVAMEDTDYPLTSCDTSMLDEIREEKQQ